MLYIPSRGIWTPPAPGILPPPREEQWRLPGRGGPRQDALGSGIFFPGGAQIRREVTKTDGGAGLSLPTPSAYFRMDAGGGANEVDTVGGALTLTSNNAVGSGTGVINSCRVFNGTNQFLSCNDAAPFRMSTAAWTMAFWAKPTTLPQNSGALVSKTDNTNFPPNLLSWYTLIRSDDTVGFFVSYNGSQVNSAVSSSKLVTTEFRLVICWYDPTVGTNGTLFCNVNNDGNTGSAMTGGVPLNSTAPVWVAKRHTNFDTWGAISVDGLAFWNQLLSSTERTTLQNAGLGHDYYSGAWH